MTHSPRLRRVLAIVRHRRRMAEITRIGWEYLRDALAEPCPVCGVVRDHLPGCEPTGDDDACPF